MVPLEQLKSRGTQGLAQVVLQNPRLCCALKSQEEELTVSQSVGIQLSEKAVPSPLHSSLHRLFGPWSFPWHFLQCIS